MPSQSQQNRTSRRNETPIPAPQIPQLRASSSTSPFQTQQQQQQTPQQKYHRTGDPIYPPHIAYQFDTLQALQQHSRQDGQVQPEQQHQQRQELQQQYLPETPQQQQTQQQQQDASMQDLEEHEYDVESDEDNNDDSPADANTATNTENDSGTGTPVAFAPLVQPITPLQLPKVRPQLKLGPYDTKDEAHNIVQEYAFAQGYCLVQTGCAKQKTGDGKYTPDTQVVRVDLQCDRGGTCKNSGTGKRKRLTHKIGCPTRIKLVCRKREASKWFIDIRNEYHNHDLDPRKIHELASYRRWRRVQAGGPSKEPIKDRHARTRKPKVMPAIPPPRFHQPGGLTEQPAAAPSGPLHVAALKGQSRILQILLDKGADVNGLDSTGRSPLHCAVEGMRMDTVQLLIDRGADVTILDSKGISVLSMAVEKGMEDAVVMFIDQGADPNK